MADPRIPYPGVTVDATGVTCIDLNLASWEAIQLAAYDSKWMPPEYTMNDWVADVCSFLKYGNSMGEQNG